jgi:N-acetylglutamate synthase-like GNAT family acetyltransferase
MSLESPREVPAASVSEIGGEPVLRPALMNDADAIHRLIDAASQTSTVLPRSRDSVCENLRDYLVAEIDGRIAGCGALHIWGLDLAEVRSLVVAEELRGRGIGGRIVQGLVAEARRLRLKRLFVLTDSEAFFFRQGFVSTDRGTLPHKVWNECILCPKFEDCGEVSLDLKL